MPKIIVLMVLAMIFGVAGMVFSNVYSVAFALLLSGLALHAGKELEKAGRQ